jgi:hypothetical protein
MKACIYQKQEPVNIPQIETGVLTDVLRMPYGVEDLRPADAVEPVERAAAVRVALQTGATSWWWAWARPATRSRTIC